MTNPYLLMVFLYTAVAVVAALDASSVSLNLLPWFNGLRWFRVHVVTLGLVTEAIFGLLVAQSVRVANRPDLPAAAQRPRWSVWVTLNAGLILLLPGIALVNATLMITGGALIFVAAVLVLASLIRATDGAEAPVANRFYGAALVFLLLGIYIGTGMWFGWTGPLNMSTPVEVHIHANNWGFMSLAFAGFLFGRYPELFGRAIAWPRSASSILLLMTAGATGLVLGPWLQSEVLSVVGIVLHITATVWLLLNVVKPLVGDIAWSRPGIWHIVTAYVWILAPVLAAPFVLLNIAGLATVGIEQNAPQALIYGWVLQFALALVPYLVAKALRPSLPASIGGNWLGLVAVHAGALSLWASMFAGAAQPILHGAAYALWGGALALLVIDLLRLLAGKTDSIVYAPFVAQA